MDSTLNLQSHWLYLPTPSKIWRCILCYSQEHFVLLPNLDDSKEPLLFRPLFLLSHYCPSFCYPKIWWPEHFVSFLVILVLFASWAADRNACTYLINLTQYDIEILANSVRLNWFLILLHECSCFMSNKD